jgi:PAS domain S-box-containing protein
MAALLVADKFGRYLEGNEEALVLLGVTSEELRGLAIGAFSGPHAELAITVWHRLAATGEAMPTGESTMYRRDGSHVRVRYLRIAPRADGTYELEMTEIPEESEVEGPPFADDAKKVLREWRAAERDVSAGDLDGAHDGAIGLRELYQHSFAEKLREPRPQPEPKLEPEPNLESVPKPEPEPKLEPEPAP